MVVGGLKIWSHIKNNKIGYTQCLARHLTKFDLRFFFCSGWIFRTLPTILVAEIIIHPKPYPDENKNSFGAVICKVVEADRSKNWEFVSNFVFFLKSI